MITSPLSCFRPVLLVRLSKDVTVVTKPADTIIFITCSVVFLVWMTSRFFLQIFLAKGNVPAKNYNFFMDILLDTIRGEIAICLEKAYEKTSLKDVARMLYLPNEETAKNYGVQVRIVTF